MHAIFNNVKLNLQLSLASVSATSFLTPLASFPGSIFLLVRDKFLKSWSLCTDSSLWNTLHPSVNGWLFLVTQICLHILSFSERREQGSHLIKINLTHAVSFLPCHFHWWLSSADNALTQDSPMGTGKNHKICKLGKGTSCCSHVSRSVMSNSLQPHGLQPTRLFCPWKFSRQEY